MQNLDFDIGSISKITKKIISEISSSRELILQIVDNVRNEQAELKEELLAIKANVSRLISEVDELEIKDKKMRQRLAEVSKNFVNYSEYDIKTVYEEASDVRIKYFEKKNEEKNLREKRTALEISYKKSMENIAGAEKILSQISIAMSYLEGDLMQVLEGSDKNSELFVGIKILEAQENERKRIARDIHDGPAQHMANVIMKADICEKIIKKNFEEGLRELADLKESVRSALKEVRNIIFDLRPMSLDDLGLNLTIQETIKSIIKESDIEIDLKLKPITDEIEPIIQVAVYRIIQEIFNNIKKHAFAKHASVKFDYGTKYLMIKITDNGRGFDVEETLNNVRTKAGSYGLIGIYDRVNQLQGEIQIKSSLGKGTVYTIKLPINREVLKDESAGH